MKTVIETPDFIVIDDFLGAEDFSNLWTHFQKQDFQFVHKKNWVKGFRLNDGSPLEGPAYLSKLDFIKNRQSMPDMPPPFSHLRHLIHQNSHLVEKQIGKEKESWDFFSLKSYLYPSGCSLSWHDDSKSRAGAFVYYTHPYWNVQWGGELVMGDRVNGELENNPAAFNLFNNHRENEFLMSRGIGISIQPKPNRLVVFASGTFHCVKRVEASAGDYARASITGFFIKANNEKN